MEENFSEISQVCRLCLCKSSDDLNNLDAGEPSLKLKLLSVVPEMNLEMVENNLICDKCQQNLNSAYNFKLKCLEIEDKIKLFLQTAVVNSIDVVDVDSVLHHDIKYESDDDLNKEKYDLNEGTNPINEDEHGVQEDVFEIKAEYNCAQCNKSFQHKVLYNKHIKLHKTNPLGCTVCDARFKSEKRLNSHMAKHNNFVCNLCGFVFKSKCSLKIHKRDHAGDVVDSKSIDNIYKCDVCDQHFYDRSYLHRHLKIHNEKMLACDICNKKFNNTGDLGRHKRIHTGEKPYLCKFCGMQFRVSSSLIRHTRAHTGEKPYICESCGRGFNQKYNLNSHMKIHTGLKPYHCETCSKDFSHKATLDSHIVKTHADGQIFKCDVCFKVFSSDEFLEKHRKEHTA